MSAVDNLMKEYSIVDLSLSLEENVPTHAPFKHIPWESPAVGQPANTFALFLDEHTGTHVDSTMHFPATGRRWIDQIPIREFIGRCGVVDCRRKRPKELVTSDDIVGWEKEHRGLSEIDALLLNYGWYEKYKPLPQGRHYLEGWPGLSRQAAEYVIRSGVRLVGCDTISIDADGAEGFPAHHVLLSNEVKVVESLANLDASPPVGGLFMAVPLKIVLGSGSPVRAFVFAPRKA
jgi:kynurenine formamidase